MRRGERGATAGNEPSRRVGLLIEVPVGHEGLDMLHGMQQLVLDGTQRVGLPLARATLAS